MQRMGEIMKKLLIIASICFAASVSAEFLPLPPSLANKAVYHIKAHQIDEFCCGYNALFNACNFEKCCGLPNRFSDYGQFRDICLKVLTQIGKSPTESVNNPTLDLLAEQCLGMQMLCNLAFNKENKIEHLFSTKTRISYMVGTPESEVKKKMKLAIEKRGQDQLMSIKNKLSKSTAACEMVHFICHIQVNSRGHGILLSLVQNKSGRGLFLWDNMNLRVDERSQAKQFIDYLCNNLQVSSRRQFLLSGIPDRWPSAPKPGYRSSWSEYDSF